MKYSIEIGKIIEGALKHDQIKVLNYTNQLISKLGKKFTYTHNLSYTSLAYAFYALNTVLRLLSRQ